ncbi:hypothetical protein ABPG72_005668 [Tetrahymena utriculariae]
MIGEKPCPYRIVDDIGGAFSMGAFAGCIIYFIKGMYYAPSSERFSQGFDLLRKRAPILGGNFAMWGALFTISECGLIHYRQVEDNWNKVAGGFITGAMLSIRGGYRQALQQGIIGGIFLGCFSFVEIAMMKFQRRAQLEQQEMQHNMMIEKQISFLKEQRPDIYAEIERQQELRKKRTQDQASNNSSGKVLAFS